MKNASFVLLAWAFCSAAPVLAAPYVWVGTDREVIAIDVETDAVAATIPTSSPMFVEAAPGARHAFAVGSTRTLLIDTRALAPTAELPGFASFVLNPARAEAFVRFPGLFPEPQPYRLFSTETYGTGGTLPPAAASIVAIDASAGRGYFASFDGIVHSVIEVDLATRAELRRFPLSAAARPGDVHPATGRLYVPVPSVGVVVFELATGRQLATIAETAALMARLNSAGTRLYVLADAVPLGSVRSFDTATHQAVGQAPNVASGGPVAMDIAPGGDKLYVVNTSGVTVFDAELRAGRTLATGSGFQARFRFIGGDAVTDILPGPATGLWWNPAEPGWGVHLTQRRNTFFAALFHYDAGGKAKWLVAPSCAMNTSCPNCVDGAICNGKIFETNAAAFFFGAFNPESVQTREVGVLEIQLTDRDRGHLTYVVDGAHRSLPIERQVYAPRVPLATDYTDLWWNPRESGWGIGITQQANMMFLTWFVYDVAGRPEWYVASSCAVVAAGNGCRGTLYRTSGPVGPVPGAGGFDRGALRVNEVGSIEVTFEGADNGIMSYTVDGRSGTKAIRRQLF